MLQEDTLKLLGLDPGASTDAIKKAATQKKADLQSKISSAPTDALKDKFRQLLDKVIAAEQSLSQASSSANRCPLSATKMADLPGMGNSYGAAGEGATLINLAAGTMLANRYQIKEQIGAGGMGAVYRAHDKNRDEDIAIKLLLPSLTAHEKARERFLDEARLSTKLSHPNIVNVYDVQQDGENYFITMELLEGQDLRQVMENRKLARQPFSIEEVQELIGQIATALDYAHKHTVHRDIKPENIWLTDDDEVKLMDFGIARLMSTSQRTQTGAAMGTAYYMAPEQLKGSKNIDGRADQYSLAVMAYELLTGEVPAGAMIPVNELRKDVPKALAATIAKALSPKPELRFASAGEFSQALAIKQGGLSLPDLGLPPQTLAIAASVIAGIVLLVVMGTSGALSNLGNLGNLLPQSAKEIEAQKAASIQLQGEVETLKRRLESRNIDLKQQVKDAERNKSSTLWQLEEWQNLVGNHIFDSTRYTKLNGLEKLSESHLRGKEYVQAETTLTQAKAEYEALLSLFTAAEKLPQSRKAAEQSKAQWDSYVSQGLGEKSAGQPAEQQLAEADTQRSQGELQAAQSSYEQATTAFGELNQPVAAKQSQAQAQAVKEKTMTGRMIRIPGKNYELGQTEVTQAQWRAVMGSNPSYEINCGDTCPVEEVSWDDIQIFLQKLNARTGKQYRLPTEAEWEYACYGGRKTEYCGSDNVDSVAWYNGNSGFNNHPVGKKQANGYGLYDMSGNVDELQSDCYEGDCAKRVLRGGAFNFPASNARAARRSWLGATLRDLWFGFRLARTLP